MALLSLDKIMKPFWLSKIARLNVTVIVVSPPTNITNNSVLRMLNPKDRFQGIFMVPWQIIEILTILKKVVSG